MADRDTVCSSANPSPAGPSRSSQRATEDARRFRSADIARCSSSERVALGSVAPSDASDPWRARAGVPAFTAPGPNAEVGRETTATGAAGDSAAPTRRRRGCLMGWVGGGLAAGLAAFRLAASAGLTCAAAGLESFGDGRGSGGGCDATLGEISSSSRSAHTSVASSAVFGTKRPRRSRGAMAARPELLARSSCSPQLLGCVGGTGTTGDTHPLRWIIPKATRQRAACRQAPTGGTNCETPQRLSSSCGG
jgi:hypothetical protein